MAHIERLMFKASYVDTAVVHRTRKHVKVRKSLRGKAKDAVRNLLNYSKNSETVMNALEKRFGRPDAIAIAEIQNLRTLQRPTDSPNSICEFAGDFTNIISSLRKLKKEYYLYNPEIIKCTLDKFTSAMKYRWFDFSAEQPQEEPDLIKMARFLEREAERCIRVAGPKRRYIRSTRRRLDSHANRFRPRSTTRSQRSKRTTHRSNSENESRNEDIKMRSDQITRRVRQNKYMHERLKTYSYHHKRRYRNQERTQKPAGGLTHTVRLGPARHRTRTIGHVHYVHNLTATTEDNMDEQLRRYFAIESLAITPKRPSNDPEQRAVNILKESTTQLEDGHYQTGLLWKEQQTKCRTITKTP
ncbi:hypothetical protein EVAR_88434_1 [Eumeta japonica]|uniref:Uncharacterized protein n=1 Tax=Eumeta variegata TaxID=151549 RepID=A0A4C1Y2B3_EUMVA|nr:hypothetical protein EVAR_88434_1 [Eumeta japonica]